MARSKITETSVDLQADSGSVLWSLIQGEALEFPVTLNFLTNAGAGYEYEAVIMEALNVSGDTSVPEVVRPSGVNTTLNVRVPFERGDWNAANAYSREDVIYYNLVYYKLAVGANRVSSTVPSSDVGFWEPYVPNKIYIQFPATLSAAPAWAVQPNIAQDVYGFFELSVQEPAGGVFRRTWKPMRGLVKLGYSPTLAVP
jgi:hypothetical protein